jgi:hypothetical protein
MARSYHTDPKWRIAARNAEADREGRFVPPPVVERAPRIADVHPVSRRKLSTMLAQLPPELWYGLRRIELRPRQGEMGCPFGSYSPRDKTIRLFSLPEVLEFEQIPAFDLALMKVTEAHIEEAGDGHRVRWDELDGMGFWFFYSVFIHELGHHHRCQYPAKRGAPGRVWEEEGLANRYRHWVLVGRMSRRKYQRKVEQTGCTERRDRASVNNRTPLARRR